MKLTLKMARIGDALKLEFCTCAIFLGLILLGFITVSKVTVPIEVTQGESYDIVSGTVDG